MTVLHKYGDVSPAGVAINFEIRFELPPPNPPHSNAIQLPTTDYWKCENLPLQDENYCFTIGNSVFQNRKLNVATSIQDFKVFKSALYTLTLYCGTQEREVLRLFDWAGQLLPICALWGRERIRSSGTNRRTDLQANWELPILRWKLAEPRKCVAFGLERSLAEFLDDTSRPVASADTAVACEILRHPFKYGRQREKGNKSVHQTKVLEKKDFWTIFIWRLFL